MPKWGLMVEQNLGYGRQQRMWSAGVMDHVDGTREEALAALRQRAERFVPVHPANPKRRALYRSDDGFLLVIDGVWQSFHLRFSVAELLYDSAAPEPENVQDAVPDPEPGPVRKAVPRVRKPPPEPPRAWDADVPDVPSWLGREDLA
ncbi:hypothetical protein NKH18_03370 [Streptomyces sp. M10(2022)]